MEKIICSNCSYLNHFSSKRRKFLCKKCGLKLREENLKEEYNNILRKKYRENTEVNLRRSLRDTKIRRQDINFGKRIQNNYPLPKEKEIYEAEKIDIDPIEQPFIRKEKKSVQAVKSVRLSEKKVIKNNDFFLQMINAIKSFIKGLFITKQLEKEEQKDNNYISDISNEIALDYKEGKFQEKELKGHYKSKDGISAANKFLDKIINKVKDYIFNKYQEIASELKLRLSQNNNKKIYLKIASIVIVVFFIIFYLDSMEVDKKFMKALNKGRVNEIHTIDEDSVISYGKASVNKGSKGIFVRNDDNSSVNQEEKIEKEDISKEKKIINFEDDQDISEDTLLKNLTLKDSKRFELNGERRSENALKKRLSRDNFFSPVKVRKRNGSWEERNSLKQYKITFNLVNTKQNTYEIPSLEIVFIGLSGEELASEKLELGKLLIANEIFSMSLSFPYLPKNVADYYVFIDEKPKRIKGN